VRDRHTTGKKKRHASVRDDCQIAITPWGRGASIRLSIKVIQANTEPVGARREPWFHCKRGKSGAQKKGQERSGSGAPIGDPSKERGLQPLCSLTARFALPTRGGTRERSPNKEFKGQRVCTVCRIGRTPQSCPQTQRRRS